jgi:hypothetical protein
VGTGTGLIAGGGIAGTLAALPMPLGSLTEPLSPRAFAGPGGMPLTPASWAGDLPGVASRPNTAKVRNAVLPIVPPQERIETSCARLMGGDSLADLFYPQDELEGGAEVPRVRGQCVQWVEPTGRANARPMINSAIPITWSLKMMGFANGSTHPTVLVHPRTHRARPSALA